MATPWRLFWLVVLAGHAVAAAAWWGMMPDGFPPAHPRFWANRVAPVAVLTLFVTAVATARRRCYDLLRPILFAFPAACAAAALAARVVFPVTFARLFALPRSAPS